MPTKPSPLPRWAETSGGTQSNIVTPNSGKQDVGFVPAEHPPAQFVNWLWNLAYRWFKWIDQIFDSNGKLVDGTVTAGSLEVTTNLDVEGNANVDGTTHHVGEVTNDAGETTAGAQKMTGQAWILGQWLLGAGGGLLGSDPVGIIAPADIGSSVVSDWDPADANTNVKLDHATVVRATCSASGGIDGIKLYSPNQMVVLINVGTHDFKIITDPSSSSSSTPQTIRGAHVDGASNTPSFVILQPNATAVLWYDLDSLKWRLLWITATVS